jgi:exopolysaccharide biosynthesis polyprenyl glycosylphosphotransferase
VTNTDIEPGRNVLIVGAGKPGRELASYLRECPGARVKVRGFVDDHVPTGGEVRGKIADLARLIRSQFVDEIILAPPHDRETFRRIAREARRNRISVTVVPDLFGFAPQSVAFGTLGKLPVLKFYEERRPIAGLACKRAADFVISALALLLTSPFLALIAALIKLDSPGPVFYRAVRVGKKGHSFLCYKFRTMGAGADRLREQLRSRNERQGPLFKIKDDPRVTYLGRFLRRYSLDELPQLWNVLKGDMSLVGPRPHPQEDFERYELDHLRRLNVVPGVTGLWQITARDDPSFDRNMQLDLQYIERWNLWLDIRILLRTVAVVLQGTGV